MAKVGAPPAPAHILKLRGSAMPSRRERAAKRQQSKKPVYKRPRARPIRDLDAIVRTGIPGYDPYAQAGDCTFDAAAARKAIGFFERDLRHVKGAKAGTPFILERWQKAIIANLFGWKWADGTRRYRECLIFVPRKSGKTPLAAGILLYLLFEDGEQGAECYCAASTYKQASLVFEWARGFVVQNPDLLARCKIYNSVQQRAIQLTQGFSTLAVTASESKGAHGWNTSAYCIDELHCLPDGELMEALETSTGARRQPLGILITTSDYERDGSPCNLKHAYACRVRDGIVVPGDSGAGLARWSGKTGVNHADEGRCRLNRAAHSDTMAA